MYRAAVSASLADAAGSDYSCSQVCYKKQTCLHTVLPHSWNKTEYRKADYTERISAILNKLNG